MENVISLTERLESWKKAFSTQEIEVWISSHGRTKFVSKNTVILSMVETTTLLESLKDIISVLYNTNLSITNN